MFKRMFWRLASPYDAYVSHVLRLEDAFARIQTLADRAVGYEMGLRSSVRLLQTNSDVVERADRFREHLSKASESMTDDQLESFLGELGGGETADVEQDRAEMAIRLDHATTSLQESFHIAGTALALLEQRAFDPKRREIARQLASNGIVPRPLEEYHRELHELATATGHAVGAPQGG